LSTALATPEPRHTTKLSQDNRVPAMYLGQARMFRQRVAASEAAIETLVPKLWQMVRSHGRQHRNPPPAVAGIWQRHMPQAGRVSLTIDSKRTALRIVEDRALVTRFRIHRWAGAEWEPSVGVSRFVIAVDHGQVTQTVQSIAEFSMHAIARRIERGSDARDDAIFDDMRARHSTYMFMPTAELSRTAPEWRMAVGTVGCRVALAPNHAA